MRLWFFLNLDTSTAKCINGCKLFNDNKYPDGTIIRDLNSSLIKNLSGALKLNF